MPPICPYLIENCSRGGNLYNEQIFATPLSSWEEEEDGYTINLDVQHFKPEEISTKVYNNSMFIEGKHEEDMDDHGFVSRHFVRRYVMPNTIDLDGMHCKCSTDGILTVYVPKKKLPEEGRKIPIMLSGCLAAMDAGNVPVTPYAADRNMDNESSTCSCS